jgi:hypothetical protein
VRILELTEIRSLLNYREALDCRRTVLLAEAVTSPISSGSPLDANELEHVYNRSPV